MAAGEKIIGIDLGTTYSSIAYVDEYVGDGYGRVTKEQLDVQLEATRLTGLLFDPTYTGKGFAGLLLDECEKEAKKLGKRGVAMATAAVLLLDAGAALARRDRRETVLWRWRPRSGNLLAFVAHRNQAPSSG